MPVGNIHIRDVKDGQPFLFGNGLIDALPVSQLIDIPQPPDGEAVQQKIVIEGDQKQLFPNSQGKAILIVVAVFIFNAALGPRRDQLTQTLPQLGQGGSRFSAGIFPIKALGPFTPADLPAAQIPFRTPVPVPGCVQRRPGICFLFI